MHILHISSELAPIAKVGGLADVVWGLSRQTNKEGYTSSVILPKYDIIDTMGIKDLQCVARNISSSFDHAVFYHSIWKGSVGGVETFFVDIHHPRHYFNRGCIYGCGDDTERFLIFCKTAIDFIIQQQLNPDIIHLHDWPTAIAAALVKENFSDTLPKVVLSIHNIDYQGRCSPELLDKVDLDRAKYFIPDKMQDHTYHDALNLLSGGITDSDFVTTVSPTYAKEVIGAEHGKGLENALKNKGSNFTGILNGIDYGYWNPQTDKHLPSHYSTLDDPSTLFQNKGFVKKMLREHFMLDECHRPIVASISRLVPQKGIDIIEHAIESTLKMNGQFILLGTSPIPEISEHFWKLKRKFADHPHVFMMLHHQEEIAHLIFSGSDMFIVPSLFEPCGLTQLIALRYGSVPIVRETGGLKDTICDIDNTQHQSPTQAGGFTFCPKTCQAFDDALSRAITCWFDNPEKWHHIALDGMKKDFSWKSPTKEYINVYKRVLS